jgi:hypothetical protein
MKVFSFDPADHSAQYEAHGWAHIRGGIDPEFLGYVQEYTEEHAADIGMDQYAIKGKKKQGKFEIPDGVRLEDILDPIAGLTGLQRDSLALSERHLQMYDEYANPDPHAHKDRYSSQVSVGLSIVVPEASSLVFWPEGDREVNRNDKAMYATIEDGNPVEVFDRPGDVVLFGGNSTWHLRRNAAGTVNLYLKFNEFNYDPLQEDPRHTEAMDVARR